MSALTDPPAARELLNSALDNGWSAQLVRRVDTSGDPFLVVKAVRGDDECVEVTWHTRETGTYRMFHAAFGTQLRRRAVSLKEAQRLVAA